MKVSFAIILSLLFLVKSAEFTYDANPQYKDSPNGYLNPCNGCQGKIVTENYKGIHGDNSLKVYLPFGYDESKQYNIFYLLHGHGENEGTIFSNDVTLQNILDHLIKDGKMDPVIVVTPTYNKSPSDDVFHEEVRKSIIPLVEGKYSTYAKSTEEADLVASRRHRAYGGFSRGSMNTWNVFTNCLDLFAYWMPLCGGASMGNNGANDAKKIFSSIEKSGLTPKDYFIFAAVGGDDMTKGGMDGLIDALKQNTGLFTYTADFSKGNLFYLNAPGKTHWWGYVKHYITIGLPYFFHE